MNKSLNTVCRVLKTGSQQGFSLVELVASLMIAGILAVALSTIVVRAMDGYVFSRDAADVSQKGQLALARMHNELLHATAISTATSDRIVFSNPDGDYVLERTGSGIGVSINPDWPVGIDLEPDMLEQLRSN